MKLLLSLLPPQFLSPPWPVNSYTVTVWETEVSLPTKFSLMLPSSRRLLCLKGFYCRERLAHLIGRLCSQVAIAPALALWAAARSAFCFFLLLLRMRCLYWTFLLPQSLLHEFFLLLEMFRWHLLLLFRLLPPCLLFGLWGYS